MYLIADFVVDFQNRYNYIEKQCIEYLYEGFTPADFLIRVTDEELRQEHLRSEKKFPDGYVESICAYRKLCTALPMHDAFLMHGSVISCQGRGIAFLARSGVGKTTHTMLWKKVYGDDIKIINGDKPIIRYIDDIPYAYGTPWAGKENMQMNDKVRLTDICFIQRSEVNVTEKADKTEVVDSFMKQVLLPSEPKSMLKALELYDRIIKDCNIWNIGCNISDEAAIVAHDSLFGGLA